VKVAHTSDWHAGRVFKQVRRLPELEAVLEALGDDLEREKVELLLHSGDVFDSGAPAAEAERAVFSFFKRVGRSGIRTVVIAGNHDSADRLAAWGGLAELVDVTVVPKPAPVSRGGVVEFTSRAGETAAIAALPFAHPRWFVTALELAEGALDQRTGQRVLGEVFARQQYADAMATLASHLASAFRRDAISILTAHTHLVGAKYSGVRSERSVHLGEEWAALPQTLPTSAQYVALGHIHSPQAVPAVPAPAEYAGSPLQMDFGEVGEEKSWVLLDLRARQPARLERVPYRGGRRLERLRMPLDVLERDAPALRASGALLWVVVPLEAPDSELNARVRQLLPSAVKVEAELPNAAPADPASRPQRGAHPVELFRCYYAANGRQPPSPEIVTEFERLLHECSEGG
jgi:exonuclease SbcD